MYNYYGAMKSDLNDYVMPEIDFEDMTAYGELFVDKDELKEVLEEQLWCADEITGNGSGSYTFNTQLAKNFVLDNFNLVRDMAWHFGVPSDEIGERILSEEWEWFDVCIRCSILSEVVAEWVDEIWSVCGGENDEK